MTIQPVTNQFIIIRRKLVESRTGYSRSTIYLKISEGLLPSTIKMGANSVGWLEHEINAIIAARVAGKSDDEIKVLVSELEAARKLAA